MQQLFQNISHKMAMRKPLSPLLLLLFAVGCGDTPAKKRAANPDPIPQAQTTPIFSARLDSLPDDSLAHESAVYQALELERRKLMVDSMLVWLSDGDSSAGLRLAQRAALNPALADALRTAHHHGVRIFVYDGTYGRIRNGVGPGRIYINERRSDEDIIEFLIGAQ